MCLDVMLRGRECCGAIGRILDSVLKKYLTGNTAAYKIWTRRINIMLWRDLLPGRRSSSRSVSSFLVEDANEAPFMVEGH